MEGTDHAQLGHGLMFMGAWQDFCDVTMVHIIDWDKSKWTLDNLILRS